MPLDPSGTRSAPEWPASQPAQFRPEALAWLRQAREALHDWARTEQSGPPSPIWQHDYRETRFEHPQTMPGWTGEVTFDQSLVDTMNRAFANHGQHRDTATLRAERAAFNSALHDFAHQLTPQGQSFNGQQRYYRSTHPGYVALEEGVVDWAVASSAPQIMRDTGLSEVSPGIDNPERVGRYPTWAASAQVLTEQVANAAGRSSDDLLRELTQQTVRGKWDHLADQLLRSDPVVDRGLSGQQRGVARQQLADTMLEQYDKVHATAAKPPQMARVEARKIAVATVQAGQGEVARLRAALTGGAPGAGPQGIVASSGSGCGVRSAADIATSGLAKPGTGTGTGTTATGSSTPTGRRTPAVDRNAANRNAERG